jgi:hypothetical protein
LDQDRLFYFGETFYLLAIISLNLNFCVLPMPAMVNSCLSDGAQQRLYLGITHDRFPPMDIGQEIDIIFPHPAEKIAANPFPYVFRNDGLGQTTQPRE